MNSESAEFEKEGQIPPSRICCYSESNYKYVDCVQKNIKSNDDRLERNRHEHPSEAGFDQEEEVWLYSRKREQARLQTDEKNMT